MIENMIACLRKIQNERFETEGVPVISPIITNNKAVRKLACLYVCLLFTKFIDFSEKKARAMKFGNKVALKASHRKIKFQLFGAHTRQVARRQISPTSDCDPFNLCIYFKKSPTLTCLEIVKKNFFSDLCLSEL